MANQGQPGPGTYNVVQPFASDALGARFGTAQRGDIAKDSPRVEEQLKKEERRMGGDAIDDLVIEMSGKPSAPVAPVRSVISHEKFLRRPEAVGRLVNNNVFPSACFVGKHNAWNHASMQAFDSATPWRMMQARFGGPEPVNRAFYHRPNEFSTEVAAAARMGLKMFGAR